VSESLKASQFGKDFVWGAATSAYQIEGAHNADGKAPSIWDTFTQKRRKVKNRDNGNVACDHYNRYKEDVALIKQMGLPAYRFSLAWTRILPAGYGGVTNQTGIDFYNRLIDELLEQGIEPYVTLYHWDLPMFLHNKGGWTNRDIQHWFTEYAQTCAQLFGDRVKNWIVLNEPMVFLALGYLVGLHAPGKRGLKKFLAGSHHAMLAQAKAARAMISENGKFRIGTTVSTVAGYPDDPNSPKDIAATKRFDALMNSLYVNPACGRGYPVEELPVLKKIYRYVKDDDMQKLSFPFHFWGINYYSRKKVKHAGWVPYIKYLEKKVPLDSERTAMGWEVYPEGLHQVLNKFSSYPEIKRIMVTENGMALHDSLQENQIDDQRRIDYYQRHLAQVLRAQGESDKIQGYFAWSLLDNFEWAEGYHPRFGLIHVDYETQKRTIKNSGLWYRDFLQS
jgi:beta-glucosidase